MSANTVHKYVCELEERQLISTESTTVTTKAGLKRNGNLRYTIRPIQLALDQFYDQQLAQMDVVAGVRESQRHSHSAVIARTQCDSLCTAVWRRWCPEGNKPPLTTGTTVSKARGRCTPSSEISATEGGK